MYILNIVLVIYVFRWWWRHKRQSRPYSYYVLLTPLEQSMCQLLLPLCRVITTCNHMPICNYSLLFQTSAWRISRWNIKWSVATTVGLSIIERMWILLLVFCFECLTVHISLMTFDHIICKHVYWQKKCSFPVLLRCHQWYPNYAYGQILHTSDNSWCAWCIKNSCSYGYAPPSTIISQVPAKRGWSNAHRDIHVHLRMSCDGNI